jgi:predicted RNA methylase
VETFAAPKIELEQYPTSVELAASMLYTVSGLGNSQNLHCVLKFHTSCKDPITNSIFVNETLPSILSQ